MKLISADRHDVFLFITLLTNIRSLDTNLVTIFVLFLFFFSTIFTKMKWGLERFLSIDQSDLIKFFKYLICVLQKWTFHNEYEIVASYFRRKSEFFFIFKSINHFHDYVNITVSPNLVRAHFLNSLEWSFSYFHGRHFSWSLSFRDISRLF